MRKLKQGIILAIAALLFLLGLASVWTPFPIGAVLMMFATFLIIGNSRSGRALVRGVRRRFRWIDRWMIWFEGRSNRKMSRVLKTTRPIESRLNDLKKNEFLMSGSAS